MSIKVLFIFTSGISLLGVEALDIDDNMRVTAQVGAGAESQFVEVSSHHFGALYPSDVGRMMRRHREAEQGEEPGQFMSVQVDANAVPTTLLQADDNPLTRLLAGLEGRLAGNSSEEELSKKEEPLSKEKMYDVEWGGYKFDFLPNTQQCVQEDALDHGVPPQSFFDVWDGTDPGTSLTISEGITVENGLMKPTKRGLRIYKSACPDDTTLTVGGQTVLPAGTTTVEIVFGIIERCTGNCAPFAVSFWHAGTGKRQKRWCWNHEGHQDKVPCEENMTATFGEWNRALLNISEFTGGGTEPIKMALEVYTSGDFRKRTALKDEVGAGGRAMVLIDSLVIGPVERPLPDNTYQKNAIPCRATLMEVCAKNVWCFDKYRCAAGHCIDGEGRCNKQRNCGDDSDEVGCEYDMGFLGTFFLNHARLLQNDKVDNSALVDSLQKADMRLMHEQIHYDSQDFWDKFHVKEFFAVKWNGKVTITDGGNYFFAWKSSGLTNVTLDGQHKHWNVTHDAWLPLSAGIYELNIKFVHRRGHPHFALEYSGADTTKITRIVPREVIKTDMPGSRCDTMHCPEGTKAKPQISDILCKGVPCSYSADIGTCCNREYKVISAGDHQTCALDKLGRPVCWGSWPGYNEEWKNHPGPFTDISTRSKYTCAVKQDTSGKADGAIECWTSNETATDLVDYSKGGVFTKVAVGGDHTCALRETGSMACTGTDDQINVPSDVFLSVAAGSAFTCGIVKSDMSVKCWGANDRGQKTPPSGIGAYTHIAAGKDHVCGISNGTAYCWGENTNNQATAPSGNQGFIEVAPGGRHTCALDGQRGAVCWGANSEGQSTPSKDDGPFTTLTSGEAHTCAIKSADASVVCWGSNFEDADDGSLEWRGQSEPPPLDSADPHHHHHHHH